MAPQEPCPCCDGLGTFLYQHEGTLPDLVRCYMCGGSGLIGCARCLDSGELWQDTEGGCEFVGYCACPGGRALAHKHCQVQQVMGISVPYYAEAVF